LAPARETSPARRTPEVAEANAQSSPAAPPAPPLSARLSVTAEPPALVIIDGEQRGRTPLVQLRLSEGKHRIAFRNQVLGETVETELSLDERATRRVHADFTSATPEVHVR
jgi:hypothetical protein